MTSEEFIDNLHVCYEGEYSNLEVKEINELIYNLNSVQKHNLYNRLRINYKYRKLPTLGHINEYLENIKPYFKSEESYSQKILKKMPQYQFEGSKNWPAEKILEKVNFLRRKQSQLWKDGLITIDMKTEELSFLYIWDSLRYVKSDNLEIARKRIIEIGPNIDLRDLEPELEKIQIEPVRKQQTQSMQDIIRDIPI